MVDSTSSIPGDRTARLPADSAGATQELAESSDWLRRLEGMDRLLRQGLLREDQRVRFLQGKEATVELYRQLIPFLQADASALLDLISNEMQLRREHGEKPSCEEYVARFPFLTEPLRRQLLPLEAIAGRLLEEVVRAVSPGPRILGASSIDAVPAASSASATKALGPVEAFILPLNPEATGILSRRDAPLEPNTQDFPAPSIRREGMPNVPGYLLQKELGRGGMGVVYQALQISLKRPVALKMILSGAYATTDQLQRFRAEAEAVARLQHPGIVQIHEIGEHNGCPFFSLEYIDGGTLAQRLREGPVLPQQVAEWIEAIASAMQHAHEQGVVHRDLKPQNILLRQDGSPVVSDFGLAKRLDAGVNVTTTGAVVGTASYMSPEQALGRSREIGPATDIYGLGAILYELLTGQPPFVDDTYESTLMKVLNDQPLPPSRLKTETAPELEAIVLKCLEKEAGARYTSMAELAEEMKRFQEGQPIWTAPIDAGLWLNLWARRAGFELLERVGRGARSEVYRARQNRLQREVALKIIRGSTHDRQELLDRLEAQAVASGAALRQMRQTDSYGVPMVEIYDLGERDGVGYCAMEFLEGGSLAQRMLGSPWPIRAAVEMVIKIAQALRTVHSSGYRHGNLKPANILFMHDGSPKLGDFDPSPPGTGDATGSAPATRRLDVSDDIFAVGTILYTLLTAKTPAEASDKFQRELPSPAKLRLDVPSELETLCLRCLSTNPTRRCERSGDLADDLERFLANFQETANLHAPPAGGPVVPGYDLLELLGRGRVGPAYKVRMGSGERFAVLQWIEPKGHVSKEDLYYYRSVLEATSRLKHTCLRQIMELGEVQGRPFVVFEYLAGGTLAQRMPGKTYPPEEACWLVENLAEGLHCAHEQGIFHGDLKPEKILLTDEGMAKITDFRLLRKEGRRCLVPSAGPFDIMLETRSGYKPPEYLRREPLTLSPAADIFALGALLFELLTGRPPELAIDQESFKRDHNQVSTRSISAGTSPLNIAPNTPRELDRICRRSLEWNPQNRYASARKLARDLRHYWESLPGHRPERGWIGSLTYWWNG